MSEEMTEFNALKSPDIRFVKDLVINRGCSENENIAIRITPDRCRTSSKQLDKVVNLQIKLQKVHHQSPPLHHESDLCKSDT